MADDPTRGESEPGSLRALLGDSVVYGLGIAMLPLGLLLVTPIIAPRVGPVGFGEIDLLATLLTLATVAAMLGLEGGLIRTFFDYAPDDRARRRTAARTALVSVLTVSTTLALVLLLTGVLFATVFETSPNSHSLTTIIAAFALLPCSCGVLISRVALRLERRRRLYVVVSSVQALAGGGAGVGLVLAGAGPTGYFAGLAIGSLVAFGIAVSSGVFSGAGATVDRDQLRTMLGFGLPLVPAALATWVAFAVDRTLLASMRGLFDVGYYAMASKLAAPLFMALSAFAVAWIPFILRQPAHRQLELRARALTAVTAATGIGFILILTLAPQAIDLLGGPKFHHSLRAVPGIAIGSLAWGIAFVLGTEFMVTRRTRVIAAVTSVAALANIALNLILIPPFGFVGAAWATAATFSLQAALYLIIERRSTPAPYRVRRLLLIGVVLLAGGGALTISSPPLVARVLFAAPVVAMLAAIAGTDREPRRVAGAPSPVSTA